ncbi:Patatin-like phospholipase [Geodermatophilus pulveris]|uniref:Patatin-like phospholipase n=1 Tax=Geodermatophilus pulveris TaxID=1564159 RepID=A0A239BYA8_9ACTN|nr:patatin-like phospholipase family protein [Geodermatophilus pulveris]SNS12642.1 Patatin-like phospholipase [Geodermatophilus pulveris]
MLPRTHVVLGGGAAMGAFQAGGLLALLEAGVPVDALHGSSVGAVNAAFLAVRPDRERAAELARLWGDPLMARVLRPGWPARARGLARSLRPGGALLDDRPLRRVVTRHVPVPDLAGLAVPVTVTTTCLDCGSAHRHDSGDVADTLAASCALPGLFRTVVLPDGHRHVDGGIVDGVPIASALEAAGPGDRVLVLDCGLAPVTGPIDVCAAASDVLPAQACGVPVAVGRTRYVPPVEGGVGALDAVLQAFTVARAVANRAAVRDALADPRVHVVPHVADAWAAGLLDALPLGPRDVSRTADLVRAGREVTRQWLDARPELVPAAVSRG